MIYLDYNATSPVSEEVKSAMLEAMAFPSNPSSVHEFGRAAKAAIEDARSKVLSLVGIDKNIGEYSLIFTSSGTEANNLIMKNFRNGRILVSAIEHMSILAHKEYNDKIDLLPVNSDGIVDLDYLRNWLELNQGPENLVSVMLANNETGIIQPLQEISEIVSSRGVLFHSDIIQGPGKIPVNVKEFGLDFATISAHKFGGPTGVGCLIYKRKHHVKPQIIGGGQEMGLRSGTQNVPAIVGFGVAAEMAKKTNPYILFLRDMLEEQLLKIDPQITIIGKGVLRLPNTSLIAKYGVTSSQQVIAFDIKGVAISAGSACSSSKVKQSHVLAAMGRLSNDKLDSAVRISLGSYSTEEDVMNFVNIWNELYCVKK